MIRALFGIALALPLTSFGLPDDAGDAATTPRPVRGMTISCQTWGWEWGTDKMVETMRELRELGVNWISIHPYAGIRGDGSVVMSRRWYGDTRWMTRPIDEAHRLGLKIMIKPHLAYWGSPFRWRGDIEFTSEEQWARFFAGYEQWITTAAEICAKADAFVVGTELDRTIGHEAQWRRIIGAVRARFGGPLTYSANWTDYENVPFWDALDVIGIQAYFPLTEQPGLPELTDLDAAWAQHIDKLSAFASRQGRKVLLAELGYGRADHAALRPWDGREGGTNAQETQRRCLTAALKAIECDERVVGAFLWKWFAGPTTRENFLLSTPTMRAVITEHWEKKGKG